MGFAGEELGLAGNGDSVSRVAQCLPLRKGSRTPSIRGWIRLQKLSLLAGREFVRLLPPGFRQRWLARRLSCAVGVGAACAGFSLPVSWVLTALPVGLQLNLPTRALGVRLHDWVSCRGRVVHTADFFLFNGDWAPLLIDAEATRTMQEARSIFAAGLNFQKAGVYREDCARLAQGRYFRRNKTLIDSRALLDQYYHRFVSLFESIGRHGVLPLSDARQREPGFDAPSAVRDWTVSLGEREIGVAIGPLGEVIVLPGAKHRLAVATVLGIERVPVEVRMVHRDWLLGLPADYPWPDRLLAGVEALAADYRGAIA